MKRMVWILVFSLAFGLFGCGGEDKEDEKDCPRFQSYQIYPLVGDADTEFELLVILKAKSENNKINKIEALAYNSDGSSTQIAFDMVQSNADTFRFLRAFKGSDVCEEGVCKLYFRVVATHASGCIKQFKSDVFVVQMPSQGDDDNDNDNGDDDDNDNDDNDDNNDNDAADDDADDFSA